VLGVRCFRAASAARRGLRLKSLALLGLALVMGRPAHANLTFNVTIIGFDAAGTAVINNALAFYSATFTDPITVAIQFHNMATGLNASSIAPLYTVDYSQYRAALGADATSADDNTALANTPVQANNPVNASASVQLKSANGRAVGLNTPGTLINIAGFCNYTGDGCIGINEAITSTGGGGPYSMLAAVEHEIDEVLGLGSGVGFSQPWAEDLFRYSANGVRTNFLSNASCSGPSGQGPLNYFSIDGGATNLDTFNNCDNGADYGDWVTHTPSQVQDAITNGTGNPFLTASSPETVALDVIGYTRAGTAPVPEPTSVILLGSVVVFVAGVKKRRAGMRKGQQLA